MSSKKFCKKCEKELSREEFYKTYGNGLSTLCKYHSNQRRKENQRLTPKPKKQLGFKKLDEEVRKNILSDLQNNMKIIKISEKYGIKYPTLLGWKKGGQLI